MPTNLVYYQRNLPHRLPPGEVLFLTFRLADSLPWAALEQLRLDFQSPAGTENSEEKYARQRRYFGRFDNHLDAATTGPTWLKQPAIADLVQQALHLHDGSHY